MAFAVGLDFLSVWDREEEPIGEGRRSLLLVDDHGHAFLAVGGLRAV